MTLAEKMGIPISPVTALAALKQFAERFAQECIFNSKDYRVEFTDGNELFFLLGFDEIGKPALFQGVMLDTDGLEVTTERLESLDEVLSALSALYLKWHPHDALSIHN